MSAIDLSCAPTRASAQKRGEQVSLFPSKNAEITVFGLLEVALQQAFQRLAVAGLGIRLFPKTIGNTGFLDGGNLITHHITQLL